MKRLLFVINDARYFFSHRQALAQAAQKAGYEIHVAVPDLTISDHDAFQSLTMHPYAFCDQNSSFKEIKALYELNSIVREIDPDLVHLVTLKSSLRWFLLLLFIFNRKSVHTIAGFGQLAGTSFWAQTGKWIMKAILAIQSRLSPSLYVVQNPDDAAELCRQHIIAPDKLFLVQGSGVNTFKYAPDQNEHPNTPFRIGTACRRLKSKGLPALVKAIRLLKEQAVPVQFHVASIPVKNDHFDAVSDEEWREWLAEGLFVDEGAVTDMPSFYNNVDAFIYLSTSGEGLAKTLLEAASAALPVITTRQPGCKEAVILGQTGYLVDPENAQDVAAAIAALAKDISKSKTMGEAGRVYVTTHFSDEIVTTRMLKIYEEALDLS